MHLLGAVDGDLMLSAELRDRLKKRFSPNTLRKLELFRADWNMQVRHLELNGIFYSLWYLFNIILAMKNQTLSPLIRKMKIYLIKDFYFL